MLPLPFFLKHVRLVTMVRTVTSGVVCTVAGTDLAVYIPDTVPSTAFRDTLGRTVGANALQTVADPENVTSGRCFVWKGVRFLTDGIHVITIVPKTVVVMAVAFKILVFVLKGARLDTKEIHV